MLSGVLLAKAPAPSVGVAFLKAAGVATILSGSFPDAESLSICAPVRHQSTHDLPFPGHAEGTLIAELEPTMLTRLPRVPS